MTCQHCGRRIGDRPRRLCSRCYYDRDVREQYPLDTSRFGCAHGVNHEYTGRSLKAASAPHRPYSEAMLAVMQQRVAAGQSVRVPGDGTLDGWAPTTEADFLEIRR